jgi:hypothetical protein
MSAPNDVRGELDSSGIAAARPARRVTMRVSFDGGRLNERGVAVALYDYAFHARALLGVEPVILHDASGSVDDEQVSRFARAFTVRPYDGAERRLEAIEDERVDVAYVLKTERARYPLSSARRTAVHEVFRFFNPHGDAYAYISAWLAAAAAASRYPAVPHIVDPLKPLGNLRSEYGVPADAVVVGRHGASSQFNVPFVKSAIEAALVARPDLWVMLLNTDRFSNHERIVHVPRPPDRQRVADFVASCDIGLNARRGGESFGLAIAEFLAQDKPVLVWRGGRDRNHLVLVDDVRMQYRTAEDLTRALVAFEPRPGGGAWRKRVEPFTPEAVMPLFARVFLAPGSRPKPRLPLGFRLAARARMRLGRWRDDRWIGR